MPLSVWRPKRLMDWAMLLFLLWFGSYAYMYVFNSGGPKPLYSYLLLLAVGVIYVAFAAAEQKRISSWLSGFLLWLVLYLAYGAFEFIRSSQDQESIQVLITLGEAVLLGSAFTIGMDDPRRVRLGSAALALLAWAGAVLNILDFHHPLFTQIPGRAAGLYGSPTVAGNFIALAMVAGSFQIPRRWRWWYIMFCGAGIAVTFSRESWILWGAAVAGLAWAGVLGRARVRWLSLSATVLVGIGLTLSLFLGQAGRALSNFGVSNYLTPDTATRLGIGASSLSGEATQQRLYVIRYSLDLATEEPLLGHGLGYTRAWNYFQGPHNMYLLFLVEGGVIGLALYLSLLGILWRTSIGIGRVLTVQILISSFFSHNHLEQAAILLIMAYIAVHGATYRSGRLAEVPPPGDVDWQPR